MSDFGLAKLRPTAVTVTSSTVRAVVSRPRLFSRHAAPQPIPKVTEAHVCPCFVTAKVKDEYQPYLMTGETGSYRFMAPEVFKHEAYGRPVDVYSFSLILHYMLTGVAPWPHLDGMRAVEAAALEDERPAVPRSCAARAPEPRPRGRSRAC